MIDDDLIEVREGPLRAWRIYRVVEIEDRKALVPLYWPYRQIASKKPAAREGNFAFEQTEWAEVDILDWSTADVAPEMFTELGAEDRHGIHAFGGIGQAILYAEQFLLNYVDFEHWPTRELILARVELQGVVVEHEYGYRAEKTRIVELWVGNLEQQEREELALAIGWPFEIGLQDLMPDGPQEVKAEPFVQVLGDVSGFTLALLDEPTRARTEHLLSNRSDPVEAFRQICTCIDSELLERHHGFLREFERRSIKVNWGLYGNSRVPRPDNMWGVVTLDARLSMMRESQLLNEYHSFLSENQVRVDFSIKKAEDLPKELHSHFMTPNGYRCRRDMWVLGDRPPVFEVDSAWGAGYDTLRNLRFASLFDLKPAKTLISKISTSS